MAAMYESAPFTPPTMDASTTALAPASSATRVASFRSFHGSTMIILIRSSFIWRMTFVRWAGDAGIPGRSSSVAAWLSPNRLRMIHDDLGALERLQRAGPAGHRLVQASKESLAVLLERGAVLGGKPGQAVDDVLRDDRRHPGIEGVVRIAKGMYVAHRAVHPRRRHVQHLDAARHVDAPGRAADDLRVVRSLDSDLGP